jgi:hypothetical protein
VNAAGRAHREPLGARGSAQRQRIGPAPDHRDVIVNAYLGNEVEGGPANLFLRRRGSPIAWTPLLDPRSPGRVALDKTGLEIERIEAQLKPSGSAVLSTSLRQPAGTLRIRP